MAWVMLMTAKAAPQADTLVSGNWVTGFVVAVIGAIFTGLAGFPFLKKRWQAEAIKNAHVTIQPPLPVVHTKEQVELVTKAELDEHLERIEQTFREIKDDLRKEREIARTANGNLHARMDKSAEALSEVKGELKGIGDNVSRLLDLATKRTRG